LIADTSAALNETTQPRPRSTPEGGKLRLISSAAWPQGLALKGVGRDHLRARLGGLVSALVAALTAAAVGLLIAGTASAAHSAAVEHARAAQMQAQQDQQASLETDAQLNAYRDRLSQAYDQLQASYWTLAQRDAAYQLALQQTETAASNLQAADRANVAKLTDAYQQVQQATARVQSLQTQLQSASEQVQRSQETPPAPPPAQIQSAPRQASPPAKAQATAPLSNQAWPPAFLPPFPFERGASRRQRAGEFDD